MSSNASRVREMRGAFRSAFLFFSLLACILVLIPNNSWAVDPSVSVSLKSWYNTYSRQLTSETTTHLITKTGESYASNKTPGFMVGPSVKVAYGGVFGGLSYLASVSDSGQSNADDSTRLFSDREDMDFVVGFMPAPCVGMFFGYKYMTIEETSRDAQIQADGTLQDYTTQRLYNIKGPGVGILGAYQIPATRLAVTGSLSYLWLRYDSDITVDKANFLTYEYRADYPGFSGEIVISYGLAEHAGVSLGYKYQKFEYEIGAQEFTETFNGLTAGINYLF